MSGQDQTTTQQTLQQSLMYRTWLGSDCIDITSMPETMQLVNAFAHLDVISDVESNLKMSIGADRATIDRTLRSGNHEAQHQRRDNEHAWLVHQPRHIQSLLSPDQRSGNAMRASVIVEDEQEIDGSIRARPGVDAISAWAATRGQIPIHASAAALNGQALIFLGQGGTGKTTTALALAQRGWDLLADDRCFLAHHAQQIMVSSLYATAILTPESQARLKALDWEDLGRTHEGKQALRLPGSIRVAPKAHLAGVVWVTRDHGTHFVPSKLSRSQALVPWLDALAPALQAHGPSAAWLRGLCGMFSAVPAWQLRIDWHFHQLDEALRSLLATLRDTSLPKSPI
jgi:hypothetical protein